jgi:hypothetical protein
MNQATWREYLAKYDGAPTCVTCGAADDELLTVDHIVPRAEGGLDEVSNLQCLCSHCNSSKGARPDKYWLQSFYFDATPDVTKYRTAQRDRGYEMVIHYGESWFSRPFSLISGFCYLLCWVVGSGKTHAATAVAFALNRVIRMHCPPGTPRVDRILVLTKEAAVRDQIADDLRRQTTGFGICNAAPRVGVVTDGSLWDTPEAIAQNDVWVACIQQLWQKDGRPRRDIAKILAHFPLIFIDEPHYALEQVLALVEYAASSLVFGLSGSPISAGGDTIRKFVVFSTYTWQDANEYDNSMKFLSSDPQRFTEFVDIISPEVATMMVMGKTHTTNSASEPGYALAPVPVKTVAEAAVRHVHELDAQYRAGMTYERAEHRPESSLAELVYPGHAMIKVDTIAMAHAIVGMLNSMFESNRMMYPVEGGYAAELVHSDIEDEVGNRLKGKKLTPDHPWMLAKSNNGQLQLGEGSKKKYSARFLVLVGMGREGVSNQLCCVVAIACEIRSVVEAVQRPIGRQLRAYVMTRETSSALLVPPKQLDTVKIITHATFQNQDVLERGIRYVMHMPDYLIGMWTMDDLVSEDDRIARPIAGADEEATITSSERLAIAEAIGEAKLNGEKVDRNQLVDRFAKGSKKRAERIEEWVRDVENEPGKASAQLRHVDSLAHIPAVMRELPMIAPSDDTLKRFARSRGPEIAGCAARLEDDASIRLLLTKWYTDHARQFHTGRLEASTDIDTIRKHVAGVVLAQLAGSFVGDRGIAFSLVGFAVKKVLGVPDGEQAAIGSKWDTPQHHVILQRPEISQNIIGFVRHQLIRKGMCPRLAAAFRIEVVRDV